MNVYMEMTGKPLHVVSGMERMRTHAQSSASGQRADAVTPCFVSCWVKPPSKPLSGN